MSLLAALVPQGRVLFFPNDGKKKQQMLILLLPNYISTLNPGIHSESLLLTLGGWLVHVDLCEQSSDLKATWHA